MTAPLPLSKPDKPGLWRVQWSNGDVETVEVVQVTYPISRETVLQFVNYARSAHHYPVGDGWLAKWWPVEDKL